MDERRSLRWVVGYYPLLPSRKDVPIQADSPDAIAAIRRNPLVLARVRPGQPPT